MNLKVSIQFVAIINLNCYTYGFSDTIAIASSTIKAIAHDRHTITRRLI